MGLEYFDLYLIHNPMSFKEGANPIPKIANVLQYSQHDYLEAWYGIEDLIRKGLVKRGGVSNFNSVQVERVVDKGKIKPVVNQVECHPYLTQQRLDDFCTTRNVKLSCFGVLGSKGTPLELKSGLPPAIDDPLVKVMSAGLGVKPGQLLIAYQIQTGRNVVVKTTDADHMWDNLQALNVKLDQSHISALNALNRNKRTFTFEGMGDTHRNYPFKIAF
nr:1,5-anhydro-D-fructose reductase-like [Vanessa tameamea]